MDRLSDKIIASVESLDDYKGYGIVSKILGMLIEIKGGDKFLTIGSRCQLTPDNRPPVLCEIVGFEGDKALALPFGDLSGIGPGCIAYLEESSPKVYPDISWLGRIIDGLGNNIDTMPPLKAGKTGIDVKRKAPPAHLRQRLGGRLDLGVKALNTFLPSCQGQRMGIFAGSGVGKSVMMSMMARFAKADVIIIGLIGERGREVQEFIQDDLGEDGLKK